MADKSELLAILAEALPVLERAAVEETRRNRAPTGLPKRNTSRELFERAKRALQSEN